MDLGKLTMSDLMIVSGLVAFVITVVMGGFYTFLAMRTGKAMSKRSGILLNKSAGTALAATGTYLLIKN